MKIAVAIVRVLLGLLFLLSGTMAFLMAFDVVPSPPIPSGSAGDFSRALNESSYMLGVAAFEIVGGVLLLIGGGFVPLGLVMIGPVIVNIAFYHLFLDRDVTNAIPAIVVSVLSLFLLRYYRGAFAGLVRGT